MVQVTDYDDNDKRIITRAVEFELEELLPLAPEAEYQGEAYNWGDSLCTMLFKLALAEIKVPNAQLLKIDIVEQRIRVVLYYVQ